MREVIADASGRCLEAASHDTVSPKERGRLLHFVVVGGGPTGVEFSAELSDFIHQDLIRYYPHVRCIVVASEARA